MNNLQTVSSGSAELQNNYDDGSSRDAMSQALKQRRLNKANKRRMTDTNEQDDLKGMDDQSQE